GTVCGGSGDVRRVAELCAASGHVLQYAGDLKAARPWHGRALDSWERELGPDHPQTAQGLRSLAWLVDIQGELTTARPLYERALDIRERVLGPDHPHTAQSLDDLANLLVGQGE